MKTAREANQLKRLKTMLDINSESKEASKSIKSQIKTLQHEPFIDISIVNFTSEPPCGKHLTDDYNEDIEEFIYTDNKHNTTCQDCLSILSTPIIKP